MFLTPPAITSRKAMYRSCCWWRMMYFLLKLSTLITVIMKSELLNWDLYKASSLFEISLELPAYSYRLRNSSGSMPACLRIALRVPSGMSPG